jgi:hypothetical protein
MGMGYSTIVEHDLGIHRLFDANPDHMRGCTVCIEAPCGIPSWDTWAGPWADEARPELLIECLQRKDLPELVGTRAVPVEEKVTVGAESVSALAREVLWCRRALFKEGGNLLVALVGTPPSALVEAGGIRTDAGGIAAARRLASERSRRDMETQRPLGDWNGTVLARLVSYVQAKGGHVVFYEMPLSSVQRAPLETPLMLAERARFRVVCALWHARFLDLPFPTTDQDFPDLWHLSAARRVEFSRAFAKALFGPG